MARSEDLPANCRQPGEQTGACRWHREVLGL